MRHLAVLVAAIGLALFAVGLSLMPLQTPGFTRTLSARYSHAAEAGLSRQRMLEVAESVRAYVVDGRGKLPATVEGRPGFETEAVSHLDDVRRVLTAVRVLVLLLGIMLAAAGLAAWRTGFRREVVQAFAAGAVATIAVPLVATAVALLDFPRFFASFHSIFFAQGTWTFPSESLLIRAFPESFWMASGLAWAFLTLACSASYAVCAASVRRLSAEIERSPSGAASD